MVLIERFLLGALFVFALCATVNHAASISTTSTSTTLTTTENVSVTTDSNDAQKEANKTDINRTENARSLDLDISKYTSSDFHNKVYDLQTSPDTEKFINHEISKVHTTYRTSFTSSSQNVNDYNYELTTPGSKLFDERHKSLQAEIKQKLEIEELVQPVEQVEKPLEILKNNKTNLDFVRFSNVVSDDDVRNKTSIHRNYETEKGLNLNYESVYNQSDIVLNNNIENEKQKAANISKRGFAKPTTPAGNTEEPLGHQSQSNLLPSLETTTSHEQTQQENNIYPVLVPIPLTTTSTTTEAANTKMYEITEDDFATTTELSYEAREASGEKFYEMTESVSTTESDTEPTTTEINSSTLETTTKEETSTTEGTFTSTLNDLTTQSSTVEITTELDSSTTPTLTTTGATNNDNLTTTQQSTDASTATSETTTQQTTSSHHILDATESTTIPAEQTSTTIEGIETTTSQNYNSIIKEHTTTNNPTTLANEIKKSNEHDLDDFTEEVTDDDYIDLQHRKAKPVLPEHKKPTQTTTTTTIEDITTIAITTTTTTTTETEEVTSSTEEVADTESGNTGTIVAIVLSTVGGICLILLAILLFVMRRRQKRFNYGQRCTPVSLDAYSMDNVSVYNSVRRKAALRGSKRSYGNPAFDDDTSVSHPLNFHAITRFALNAEDIKAEFDEIPQVNAKMNELPDGCDTKNRYANVIPLPESRVYLNVMDEDPTSDYINANYVTGPKGMRGYYIACQAPLHNTVNDFWRMIWEQQSKVILMATHLFENGVEKCVDYLPPSEVVDCHRLFGDYQVTLKKREVKDKYIISSLQLKNMVSNSWREVTHLWYSGWPEKGVPEEENSIIAFLIEARSYVKLVQNVELKENGISANTSSGGAGRTRSEQSPVVVHCSPGTGRTGTVIACDIAIREFELRRIVDIPRIVYRIRRDRASSVQTKDQYHFIYKVINLYATKLTGGALDSI